jgi:hypothetical protein
VQAGAKEHEAEHSDGERAEEPAPNDPAVEPLFIRDEHRDEHGDGGDEEPDQNTLVLTRR